MGGHGMMGHHFHHHFPNFRNHFLRNQFLRNQAFFGNGWGWGGWGLGGYGEGGNTTVVNFPSAIPGAEVTGSTSRPCRLQAETFTVPSSAGGTKPVEIVGCR
jgi:hypothetical protein